MAAVLVIAGAASLTAQKTTQVHPGKAGSPHVRTEWTIDGANISIEYGRPSLKGRPEAQMMPLGEPWRTGADEATVLKTDKPLKFGTLSLEPGPVGRSLQQSARDWPGADEPPYGKDARGTGDDLRRGHTQGGCAEG